MAGARTNPHPLLVLVKLIGTIAIAGVLAAGVLLPFVGGAGLAAKHEADKFLNTTCNLQETAPPQKSQVFARDGHTLIATIFKQDRQPIPLSSIPKSLQQALVATEDRRFYQHHGVDMRGLIRSAINTSSGETQGGSTLTMQYVKQIRLYQAGDNIKKQDEAIAQNLNRKIEDAKCALYIEATLHESKDKILENYLNIATFGENSFGIETAAETFFDKTAAQLTVPESAMLVGLLRAPGDYDPFIHPDAARQRRNEVLQNMVTVGDLTQAQAARYQATPVSLATTSPPPVREGCDNAPTKIANVGFFCKYAVNWLLTNKVVTDAQLETGGLRIVTTLNPQLQNTMQGNLARTLPANGPMTAVMPVVDPHTGDVLAMATSKKYGSTKNATTLPIFTSYTAQGASTYKLFPLLTALSTGIPSGWQLQTPPAGQKYKWTHCPDNGPVGNGDANERFFNNETLTSATAKSSNTYFTGLADQLFECNLQPIIDMAGKLGMRSLEQPSDERGLTVGQQIIKYSSAKRLVLGDIATSPLELAGAYAAVANDGLFNAPAPILSVADSKGHPIPAQRTPGVQVVSPEVARRAVDILIHDTKAPGTSAASFHKWYPQNRSLIAGKTGTAPGRNLKTGKDDKNGALWFVGMTPDLVATTALINLDSPSYPASGLPHLKNPQDNAYGAYAAGVWLAALKPVLVTRHWTWPSWLAVPGDTVPDITGMTPDEARAQLKRSHFTMRMLDSADGLECPSTVLEGHIAFYAPDKAPRGSTITVCPSSGTEQAIYTPPPPPPPPPPPANNTSRGGPSPTPHGSSGTGQSSATGHSSPPGHHHDHSGGPSPGGSRTHRPRH